MKDLDKWYDSLIRCATDLELFTTDDVIAQYAHRHGPTNSNKPVGGAIVKAAMAGFIEKTGELSDSVPPKHVYRSKLHAHV